MTVAAAICAVVALAGLALIPLNIRAFPPLDRSKAGDGLPGVSVLVPARNEERDLERAIRSHLASDYPNLEVVVVDDRSTDGTAEILHRLAAESPRLTVVEGEEPPPGWLGKPHALWQAARRASGEWLLFVDADVVYAPETIRNAVNHARAKGIDLLCLLPRFDTSGFWEEVLMPNLASLIYMGPGYLLNLDGFRLGAVGGGSGNLVSRAAYAAVGGHESLRNSVIDDVALAALVRRLGLRARGVTAFDRVSVRMYRGFSEIVDGFTKNVAFMFPRAWMMIPDVLFFWTLTFLPWAVLLFGSSHRLAARLSAIAIAATFLGRVIVARITGGKPWSACLHPLMIAVWGWIGLRSAWRRGFHGRVDWRGRTTHARDAR